MKMRYLSQRNKLYNLNIRRYGCYLLSILRIVEELKTREFEHSEVEEYYKTFTKYGWILKNCRVEDPNSIFSFFGIIVITKKEKANYKLSKFDLPYFVSCIKTSFFITHFVLCKVSIGQSLSIANKIWDSLFLVNNNYSLHNDAFRIFRKT